jgi:hypothetical protein
MAAALLQLVANGMQQKLATMLDRPKEMSSNLISCSLYATSLHLEELRQNTCRVPRLLPANSGSAGVSANLPDDQTIEQPLGQTESSNLRSHYLICSLRV